MSKPKTAMKDALTSKPARPLDPQALSNDKAALTNLVAQLNTTPRGVDPNAPVDTTKYSGEVGAGNATLAINSDAELAQAESFLAGQRAAQQPPAPIPSAPPPVQQPQASVPPQRARRLVLTGRALDSLPEQVNGVHFRLDEAVKTIVAWFFENAKPGDPGYQEFFDKVLAWGAGEVSALYPLTVERALFMEIVHNEIGDEKFGTDAGYWTDSIVNRIKELGPDAKVIVTGVPDQIALRFFQTMGFQHWHLTGPPTNDSHLDAFASSLDGEVIRALSQQRNGPKLRAVWRHPSQGNPRLWTEQEFIAAHR